MTPDLAPVALAAERAPSPQLSQELLKVVFRELVKPQSNTPVYYRYRHPESILINKTLLGGRAVSRSFYSIASKHCFGDLDIGYGYYPLSPARYEGLSRLIASPVQIEGGILAHVDNLQIDIPDPSSTHVQEAGPVYEAIVQLLTLIMTIASPRSSPTSASPRLFTSLSLNCGFLSGCLPHWSDLPHSLQETIVEVFSSKTLTCHLRMDSLWGVPPVLFQSLHVEALDLCFVDLDNHPSYLPLDPDDPCPPDASTSPILSPSTDERDDDDHFSPDTTSPILRLSTDGLVPPFPAFDQVRELTVRLGQGRYTFQLIAYTSQTLQTLKIFHWRTGGLDLLDDGRYTSLSVLYQTRFMQLKTITLTTRHLSNSCICNHLGRAASKEEIGHASFQVVASICDGLFTYLGPPKDSNRFESLEEVVVVVELLLEYELAQKRNPCHWDSSDDRTQTDTSLDHLQGSWSNAERYLVAFLDGRGRHNGAPQRPLPVVRIRFDLTIFTLDWDKSTELDLNRQQDELGYVEETNWPLCSVPDIFPRCVEQYPDNVVFTSSYAFEIA